MLTIISCRFIPTPEQAIPGWKADEIDAHAKLGEDMRREYWHEAIVAGFATAK
jgi:hypothetical protein